MYNKIHANFRVYVGLIPTGYLNPDAIEHTITQGMIYCGIFPKLEAIQKNPHSTILIKPEIPYADRYLAPYCYSHPKVLSGAIESISKQAPTAQYKVLIETLPQVPTKRVFERAYGNLDYFKGKAELVLKSKQARYLLSKENYQTGTEILTSELYATSSFCVFVPKLKLNVLYKGISGAVALNFPLQSKSAHYFKRSIQACAMLEVCNPDLIVSDGLTASCGGSITGRGFELGALLVSNNALAHDWIAAQVFNLEPLEIPHLALASSGGWGPKNNAEIEVGGAGVEGIRLLRGKTRGWLEEKTIFHLGKLKSCALQSYAQKQNISLPVEVLMDDSHELTGAHAEVLDWMISKFDFKGVRNRIKNWPAFTICVGEIKAYPTNSMVFVIGRDTCKHLQKLVSHGWKICIPGVIQKWVGGPSSIRRVQFKNGKSATVIEIIEQISNHHIRYRDLYLTFFIFSLGRIGWHWLRPSVICDFVVQLFLDLRQGIYLRRLKQRSPKVVLTSHLK